MNLCDHVLDSSVTFVRVSSITLSLSLAVFLSESLSVCLSSLSFCLSVRVHMDLTLSLSCTLFSLVTELLCALDHSSNAFALAHKAELHVSW